MKPNPTIKVGDTCRQDHGDKVTERTVVEVKPGHVVSVSRWISGTPYQWQGQTPHDFRWVCTHEQWELHRLGAASVGMLILEHWRTRGDHESGDKLRRLADFLRVRHRQTYHGTKALFERVLGAPIRLSEFEEVMRGDDY